jgi:hypothetical protein
LYRRASPRQSCFWSSRGTAKLRPSRANLLQRLGCDVRRHRAQAGLIQAIKRGAQIIGHRAEASFERYQYELTHPAPLALCLAFRTALFEPFGTSFFKSALSASAAQFFCDTRLVKQLLEHLITPESSKDGLGAIAQAGENGEQAHERRTLAPLNRLLARFVRHALCVMMAIHLPASLVCLVWRMPPTYRRARDLMRKVPLSCKTPWLPPSAHS